MFDFEDYTSLSTITG